MTLMTKGLRLLLISLFLLVVLSGCATVQYDKIDPKTGDVVKKDYGVVYYEEKPFLLVQYQNDGKGSKNAIVSQVILPDKTKAYKARVTQGFGSAELNLELQHMVLTSTIGKTDNNETVAGLLNAVGTLAKVPSEIAYQAAQTDELEAAIKAESSFMPRDCSEKFTWKWQKLMKTAKELLEKTSTNSADKRSAAIKIMNTWKEELCANPEANFERNDLYIIDQIKICREALAKFKGQLSTVTEKLNEYKDAVACDTAPNTKECKNIAQAKKKIERIDAEMAAYLPKEVKPLPAFELYEIKYNPDTGTFEGLEKRYP